MNILVVASYYPNEGHPFSGIFSERNAITLKGMCDCVEVLVPRPYVPSLLSSSTPRWKAYAQIPPQEVRNGIPVYRPAFFQFPGVGSAFWSDAGAFLSCRRTAREMHRRVGFDAIVSFDLFGGGGLAWRLSRELGIPASGWGYGRDLAQPAGTSKERVVLRALKNLQLVFYQGRELFETASGLLKIPPDKMPSEKHVVLAHGIYEPPALPREEIRNRFRSAWGVKDDEVLVLNIGRIVRDKGIFELLEAISLTVNKNDRIRCVIVGSHEGFDDTPAVQKMLEGNPILRKRVKLLPSCLPDQVYEYLCAADIFAFPSHQRFEGMPNSLQEAMVMGVPSVSFAIRPVLELDAGTGALLHVPCFDTFLFAEAILRLADSPELRIRLGEIGKDEVLSRFMVRKNMALALQRLSQMVQRYSSQTG